MALLIGPLHSDQASGTIGNTITYSRWKGKPYARFRVVPNNPMTPAQISVRTALRLLTEAWRLEETLGTDPNDQVVDAAYKALWNVAVGSRAMSGFNFYVKRYMEQFRDAGMYPTSLADITPIVTPS